jgi:pimeloyl-ACP methyl ester carboxylesterase
MSTLDVPGAQLYYETYGSGPLMLMIPGANGDADAFTAVTPHLAAQYTVATYDRRGFSRSHLDGPQDYDHRLGTDADDARRLAQHLSDEPAIIFGASSGGVVALEVLTRYPRLVRTVVAFEPAAVLQLPDGQAWVGFFHGVYDRYRSAGMETALKEFRERTYAPSDLQAMARARDPNRGAHVRANAAYWFEHELRQYPAVDLDLTALTAHADRVIPAGGRQSPGHPAYQVSVELGKKLRRDLIELPGGHVGFLTHPAEFARELIAALAESA